MRIRLLLPCLLILLASACGAAAGHSPAGGPRAPVAAASVSTPLCGAATTAPITHVVLIMMENTSAATANALPYVTRLRHHCGLATDYHAVTHPSLGNYIALTSGSIPRSIRGTDCSPSATCRSLHGSIFGQLGDRWRVYAQSMPSPCYTGTTSLYAVRHTAAPYYPAVRAACRHQQVRLRNLRTALADGRLHRFSLVVPNVVDDMHNGCASCGNDFLKTWIGRIHASPQYQDGSTVVFVTWDENDGTSGNQVSLLAMSPRTPAGARVTARLTHYSLLRSIEALLGLPYLGAAKTAPGGINRGFGLR
ncbi:MAG TPA: alkaline phosphatase family protein [Gaiellales bacterium]|nr:alkaline phosphatase family protein [Gaiellales bacterium]